MLYAHLTGLWTIASIIDSVGDLDGVLVVSQRPLLEFINYITPMSSKIKYIGTQGKFHIFYIRV